MTVGRVTELRRSIQASPRDIRLGKTAPRKPEWAAVDEILSEREAINIRRAELPDIRFLHASLRASSGIAVDASGCVPVPPAVDPPTLVGAGGQDCRRAAPTR